jgi:hypothetical protein
MERLSNYQQWCLGGLLKLRIIPTHMERLMGDIERSFLSITKKCQRTHCSEGLEFDKFNLSFLEVRESV